MRLKLYRQCLLACCILLLSGCLGAASERLQSLASGPQVIWVPAVMNAGQPSIQPTGHLELVGQIGGQMKGIAVQGDYAYVGVGPRLMVLDLSEPARPILVGQTPVLPDLVRDVSVNGNIADVTTEAGEQRMIDVTDPANPRDITDTSVQTASAHAAVMSALPDQTAHDMAIVDSYAYVAVDDGVRVVSAADGRPSTIVGSIEMSEPAQHLAVANGHVYVAAGRSGLKIIDASNAVQPAEVGGYSSLDAAVDVQVAGDVAYVVDPWSGLHLIDVRNPGAPTEIGRFDTPGLSSDVFVANNRAYLVDPWFGLHVVDVTNGGSPVLQGIYAVPQIAQAVVTLRDQVAYLAAEADGLWVIDLSNPATPVAVKRIELPEISGGLALADGYLYVAAGESGLHVFNIANPLDPQAISVYDALGYAGDVDVAGKLAYVADEWSGLQIVDVANPTQLAGVATLEVGSVRDVDVVGNSVYLAADEMGLHVVDVSDPSAPREAPEYDVPGDAIKVAVQNGYAYLAAGGAGLQIISLSAATTPVIGEWAMGYGRDIFTAGQYAYLASEQDGLQVINVATPTMPERVEHLDTFGSATGIHGTGEYLYVADGVGGLLVFKTRPEQE